MLLAAGLGTRLSPLTETLPKPVVPVANRPLAGFAIDHLWRSGYRSIVANTHPLPELVEGILRAYAPSGLDLRFSRESTLLGTGGGIRRAWSLFASPSSSVVVMNGDTLFAPDLRRAIDLHHERGAIATMILRRTQDPSRFGAVGIDQEGWVRRLLGAPVSSEILDELMFTGVHILSSEAREFLPESGCIVRHAYRHWVDSGAPVLGLVDDSPWADLGTLEAYHRVNLELASGSRAWPGVVAHGGNLLADELSVDETKIRSSVVGEGVTLAQGASLSRCVVWPNARIEESAQDAVITETHRLAITRDP
ncbi:MAG: NDP-sugar synthase [Myxococcota bacterium]